MVSQYIGQTQQQQMSQVLAPQLVQSLHFLQLPVLELQAAIQEEMEANPTLEEVTVLSDGLEINEPEAAEKAGDEPEEMDFDKEFEILADLDDEWRDYFQMDQSGSQPSSDAQERREHMLNSISKEESLQEHLMAQMPLSDISAEDAKIAELLIGSIDDDGYFITTTEKLAQATGYDELHLNQILTIIQEFNPVGVGARDLKECLLLQLDRLDMAHSPAAELVENYLDLLAVKKISAIARAMKITEEDVKQIAHFIATLEPKPGRIFCSETSSYVLPEVFVEKVDGEYVVTVNNDQIPHLYISNHYRKLMKNPKTTTETKQYIREKIQAGKFLISSINQRQDTIFRIASAIVRVQTAFLDHGVKQLKPLVMGEIAKELGIHETTVSRAIANKYMQTPRGLFDMKYFFTPGLKTASGETISNTTIKNMIQQFVAEEDTLKPLSDQRLVNLLEEKGVKVARRTVAKYRDKLKIPPSHLRKSF